MYLKNFQKCIEICVSNAAKFKFSKKEALFFVILTLNQTYSKQWNIYIYAPFLSCFLFPRFQIKPGLSAYASNPEAAANSLKSLLEAAESVVPTSLRSNTPIKLGVRLTIYLLGNGFSSWSWINRIKHNPIIRHM